VRRHKPKLRLERLVAKGFDPRAYATRPWKITAYQHDGDHIDLGGRTLEIVAAPGHTPDSVCLLDRHDGLLSTGDTYYSGPIWLHAPETNLEAYDTSIKRLTAVAPSVKIVFGAHNAPVASPSILPRLVAAFEAVRSGTISATPASPGKLLYKVDGFSFLISSSEAFRSR
jgi:glyoxylase-like metal-dependent hydrolase (beta-lactamase superfamily II)